MIKALSKTNKAFLLSTLTSSLLATGAYAQSLENVSLKLLRKDTDKAHEITLRLETTEETASCVISEGIDHEVKISQHALDIKTNGYSLRDPLEGESCSASIPVIRADVTLNQKDLIKNNVKEVIFTEEGYIDIYKLTIDGTSIALKSNTPEPMLFDQDEWKLGGRDPLSNHFLEKDAVILYVKEYPHINIMPHISTFVENNNLKLTNYLETEPTIDQLQNRMIFPVRDPSGKFNDTLKNEDEHKIGEISVLNDRSGPFRNRPEVSVFDLYVKKP